MDLAASGPNSLLAECSDEVCSTILNARAPSTWVQYENRWQLFSAWCSDRAQDPVHCSVPEILEFLQSLLDGDQLAMAIQLL